MQNYPPLLHETADPPKKLRILGQPLNPKDRYFAIVGTRRPSSYGKQMAEEFSFALASRGFVIVSGLAFGIDAIAHRAALDAGGKTIAVLGSGLNHIGPPCNIPLAREIQKTGAIITEYDDDVAPAKHTFPERNRIIAGMSLATLVIEAPVHSGALITGRLALEYNRDVFALPGNITQETSRGANQLIRDCKAFPVTCLEDIFEYLGIGGAIETSNNGNAAHVLSSDEKTIYELLKNSPLHVDDISANTKLPTSRVNAILSLLELKGLVIVNGAYAFTTR